MAMIECRGLTKRYQVGQEEVRALDCVDLDIEEGEFVAILGPSGSGKSTLMHILGFLDHPTEGKLILDGDELSQTNEAQRAGIRSEKVGFVFQAFNLLPRLNVLHNVMLPLSYHRGGARDARERALGALEEVGLGDRVKHRPSQLSGGQRQRVAVARALVNDPRLILADEPTGNLDSATARMLLEAFKELNGRGRTLVLVTHDVNVASYANRQIQVLDGKITEVKL